MSNVLIGIIGVILFIGLALAGALILGDDFRTASSSSQAAAVVAQLQQTQSAVEMWRLKTGRRVVMTQDTSFLQPRFLKSAALNPASWAQGQGLAYWKAVFFNNDVDANGDNEGMGQVAGWAMSVLGPIANQKAVDTCTAIEEAQGRSGIVTTRYPTNPIGCVNNGGGYVVAFATIGQ